MVCASLREVLYLPTFTVRISDLLLNMLVRCGITAFPQYLNDQVEKCIAYAECFVECKITNSLRT